MKPGVTINVEHRKFSLKASDYHCYCCSLGVRQAWGFGKPGGSASLGVRIRQVTLGPRLEQHSQRAGGEGGAPPGPVTQLATCLPALGCVGPIRESSFLSLQNSTHPPLRSSLCPPGPVSRTAAVSGADGLGACERTTCSHCSPATPPPPTPTVPAPASNCSHCTPRFPVGSGAVGTL